MPLHWHNALSLLFHKVADPFYSPYNLLMTHANIIMYGLCHSPAYIFVFFFFARCSSCDLGRCSASSSVNPCGLTLLFILFLLRLFSFSLFSNTSGYYYFKMIALYTIRAFSFLPCFFLYNTPFSKDISGRRGYSCICFYLFNTLPASCCFNSNLRRCSIGSVYPFG